MERLKRTIGIALTVMFFAGTAAAQTWGTVLRTGTNGVSLEVVRSFGLRFNARVGGSYFTYSYTDTGSKDYIMDADLRFSSVTAMVDWFPRRGIFHFTGGVIYNLNDADAVMIPKESHDVGGRTYTPEMLGTLSAAFGFKPVAPYLGIGFGNAHVSSGFVFDIGIMYQGPPSVDLTANRLLEPSTEQAPIIEKNLEWFRLYPVVSLGYVLVLN